MTSPLVMVGYFFFFFFFSQILGVPSHGVESGKLLVRESGRSFKNGLTPVGFASLISEIGVWEKILVCFYMGIETFRNSYEVNQFVP